MNALVWGGTSCVRRPEIYLPYVLPTSKWYLEPGRPWPPNRFPNTHKTPSLAFNNLTPIPIPHTCLQLEPGISTDQAELGKEVRTPAFGTPLALLDIEAQSALSTAVLANSIAHALRSAVLVGHVTGLLGA